MTDGLGDITVFGRPGLLMLLEKAHLERCKAIAVEDVGKIKDLLGPHSPLG